MTGMFHDDARSYFRQYQLRKSLFFALILLFLILFAGKVSAVPARIDFISEQGQDTVKPKITNEARSRNFYDSIYRKFHRSNLTKLLYDLAFISPPELTLPDTVQKIKSQSPFDRYEGKVIRNISIKSLDPFGTSVVDTTANAQSGVGQALNKVHIQTREYIIRRQILFKKGDLVDPIRFGDNIRIIRELPYISSANIIITQPDPENDSVDVIIITKDVWSIGFDVPVIAPNKVVFRIYDANFIGQGARFTNTFSMETNRLPFFRYDGASYTYSNISGSFIDANVHFNQDDDRNMNIGGGFQRAFFATKTRWAGGLDLEYNRFVDVRNDTLQYVSYFTDQNLWLGQAFLLKHRRIPTRFILSEAVYWRDFSSRPHVTVDTNSTYFNNLQFFLGLSVSRNNYYVSDYIFRFGLPENVPYGRLIEVIFGPQRTDFYTRFYGGINLSAGDFIRSAGYFSAYIKSGGYFYHHNIEDAVVKVGLNYMTPLFPGKNKGYRFRTFFSGDYRVGFNLQAHNRSKFNLNNDLTIGRIGSDTVFKGTQLLAGNLRMIMYTPWFFYGFKFALMLHFQGGLIAKNEENLLRQPFYTGIGTGIFIRNDNLIFPTLTISFYFYPTHPDGMQWFQVNFLQNATYNFPDFNVSQPHPETLEN